MKTGEKWICIKDFMVGDIKINEVVEITLVHDNTYSSLPYSAFKSFEDYFNCAYEVKLKNGFRNFTIDEFKEHFLEFSKFREKRIEELFN